MDHRKIPTLVIEHCLCDGCKNKFNKLNDKIPQVHSIKFYTEERKATISGAVDPATVREELAKEGIIKPKMWEESRSRVGPSGSKSTSRVSRSDSRSRVSQSGSRSRSESRSRIRGNENQSPSLSKSRVHQNGSRSQSPTRSRGRGGRSGSGVHRGQVHHIPRDQVRGLPLVQERPPREPHKRAGNV